MRASIKNINLPPAPKTATKSVRDNRFYSYGNHTYMISPQITDLDNANNREVAERARDRKKQEAKKRHDIVASMAIAGKTDQEIAEATGYAIKTVRRVLTLMRKAGQDIPYRQTGRKKKCVE